MRTENRRSKMLDFEDVPHRAKSAIIPGLVALISVLSVASAAVSLIAMG